MALPGGAGYDLGMLRNVFPYHEEGYLNVAAGE